MVCVFKVEKNREIRGVSFFCQWKETFYQKNQRFEIHLTTTWSSGKGFSLPLTYPIHPENLKYHQYFFLRLSGTLKIFQQCNRNCSKEIASKGLGWDHSVFYDLKWWMLSESSKSLTWIGQTLEMRCSVKGEYSITGYSWFWMCSFKSGLKRLASHRLTREGLSWEGNRP